MPIVRSILFLVLLDQVTKLVFRFYGHELDMQLILIEGYLYIGEVVFNYGNAFLPSGTEETGVVSLIISYGGVSFDAPIDVDAENPLGRVDVVITARGNAIVSWLAQNEGGFRYREITSDGQIGDAIKVASMATRRASGFPKMIETNGELIFAWTDTLADVPRVRTSMMRLP